MPGTLRGGRPLLVLCTLVIAPWYAAAGNLKVSVLPGHGAFNPIPECAPPVKIPEYSMEERLCTCQTAWTHHLNPLLPNDLQPPWESSGAESSTQRCREVVTLASGKAVRELENMTKTWEDKGCRFRQNSSSPTTSNGTAPTEEKALRESVQSRGDPRRLAEFYRKLQTCGSDRPVSIAILGGSETTGMGCQGKQIKHDEFLGLPNASTLNPEMSGYPSVLMRGNEFCPWANRLKILLSAAHPNCKQMDVYNLAWGATDTQWVRALLDFWPPLRSA